MLIDIRSYLNSAVGNNVVYFKPNPGNAGDSLIAYATYQLFDELGLRYNTITDDNCFDGAGKILIYGGGGNFVEYYSGARNFVQRFHSKAVKFIILPSTISGHKEVLSSFGSNVDVLCREMTSFDYVKCTSRHANVYAADDMAFSLDLNRAFAEHVPGWWSVALRKVIYKVVGNTKHRDLPSPGLIARNQWKIYTKSLTDWFQESGADLNCFRTDSEKNNFDTPSQNIDLSRIFEYGAHGVGLASYSSIRLLSYMNRVSTINTNRLHLAIAGALLGKRVNFYSNSYYKCKAVYEFSMADRFPNVIWKG